MTRNRSASTRNMSANRASLPQRAPAPLRGETRASSLELGMQPAKHLVSGDGLYRTRVDFRGAPAHLPKPGDLHRRLSRAVELFPKNAQQGFLLSRAEGANFLLDLGKWTGHASDGISDREWVQSAHSPTANHP